jgi:hypothetical protein
MDGIADMFAELSGYDDYEHALASYAVVVNEKEREYRADPFNRERAKQAAAAWREANPERDTMNRRAWYRANKESVLEKAKQRRRVAENRARNNERNRMYRERDPQKWREANTRAQRERRARLRAARTQTQGVLFQ